MAVRKTTSGSQSSTNSDSYTNGGSSSYGGSSTYGGSSSDSYGGSHSSTIGGSSSSTYGGSNSTTSTSSYGGSSSNTIGQSQSNTSSLGGSTGTTTGKNWASGQVSDKTQANYNKYGNDYVQSQNVTNAYNALQQAISGKPTFQSQYEDKLSSMYDKVMNRDKFNYNFNEDAMYQMYKDQYTQQGKQAMQDTMGQASALTGGYGSSYSQTAGQQTYQNYLRDLNNMIPQLRQQAYEEYKDQGQELLNQYNLTNDAYNREYGQYRDTMADWQSDRSFDYGMYSDERNFDYDKYMSDRNYWQSQYWNERNAEQSNMSVNNASNWSNANTNTNSISKTDSSNWSNSLSNTSSTNWSNTNTSSWSDTDTSTWNHTDSKNWSDTTNWNDTTNWSNTNTNSNTRQSGWENSYSNDGASNGANTQWAVQNAATYDERNNIINDPVNGLYSMYKSGDRKGVAEVLVGLRENGLTRPDGTHISFSEHDIAQQFRNMMSSNDGRGGTANYTDQEALDLIGKWYREKEKK